MSTFSDIILATYDQNEMCFVSSKYKCSTQISVKSLIHNWFLYIVSYGCKPAIATLTSFGKGVGILPYEERDGELGGLLEEITIKSSEIQCLKSKKGC